MKSLVAGLVSLFVAAGCGSSAPPTAKPAAAAPNPALVKMIEGLDRGLAARPKDQVLLLLRAAFSAEAGRTAEALAHLERLDATGWDVPFSASDFRQLAGERRFQDIAARIAARSQRVKRSELAFTIAGAADLIPEGIAVDPATSTFYVGSIRKRTILAIGRGGKARTFVPAGRDGISGVLGLKVDAARGVLWAASWASDGMEGYTKADEGRAELTAFALADGSKRRRIAFSAGAGPHLLNDIAIAPDGTLYVTDSIAGAVWRVPADRDVFEPVMPPESFAYPNGIVLAWTGALLVAHGTGVAVIDPASGLVERMESAPNIPLGGIDGMLLDGHTLYAVQNGLGAPRIVAIELDESG
jgi:sugar lactone lactonase YvrE